MAGKRGNNIQKILEMKSMKQIELARLIGLSRSHMSQIVHGRQRPGIDLAIKISKALGEPVEEVFYDKPPSTQAA